MLSCCTHDITNGKRWYYKIISKRSKPKDVCQFITLCIYSEYRIIKTKMQLYLTTLGTSDSMDS